MAPNDFYVRFWGVRGSIACCAPETSKYGGNTSSLEIRCGDRLLMFDAGSGIRYLGASLKNSPPLDGDLFFTHTHFDHICGLPFFGPFFQDDHHFRIWAGHLLPNSSIHQILKDMMAAPLFPVPPEIFNANLDFKDFSSGDRLDLGDGIVMRTATLNHPDGATGYRVEYQGNSICYITDTEHVDTGPDQNILDLIRDADIVIYDSTYTDDEFPQFVGYGHSTWQEGVRLCRQANVKTFVVFHHDPDHNDTFMDRVAVEVDAELPGAVVAREGMILRP